MALQASDFSNYKHCYHENRFFYEFYLSNDCELSTLGRLHLLGLRFLIDVRLGDQTEASNDSSAIFQVIEKDQYLEQEFHRKYLK